MTTKLKILYLCTGNSCRSQMAEGWTRAIKGDQVEAYSAGIEAHGLDPRARAVMAEAGIDISGQVSKNLETFRNITFDVVITVCDKARETCPFFSGAKKMLHVGFSDPPVMANMLALQGADDEAQYNCYRRVRDEIKAFVETLPKSLETKESPAGRAD